MSKKTKTTKLKSQLESLIDSKERPDIDPIDGINFVLVQLRRYGKSVDATDDIIRNGRLTFEELIGALLLARDEIERGRTCSRS